MKVTKPKNEKWGDKSLVSPYLQILLIAVSASILVLACYIKYLVFQPVDEPIQIETLTPERLREFGGFPQYINVGLHIDRFQEFDTTRNKFRFSGSLWFEFEVGTVSLETLEKFSFQRGNVLSRSDVDSSLNGLSSTSTLLIRYIIDVEFNSGLQYRDFPLDDHRISLVLTHPFVSPDEIIFQTKTTDFTLQSDLLTFGWNTLDKSTRSGYTFAKMSEQILEEKVVQPVVEFSIDIRRYGIRYLLSILLPILLTHYLMYFAFSVDKGSGIAITLGGITGMLAYRYVIEQLSPMTGIMMLSDHFFFMLLTSSALVFIIDQIDVFLSPLNAKLKIFGIIAVHLFTISASIFIFVVM